MVDPKLQMARRVAAAAYVGSDAWHDGLRTQILTGNCDDGPVVVAALAAIEECTESERDRLVTLWHENPVGIGLPTLLGMTEAEYAEWATTGHLKGPPQ